MRNFSIICAAALFVSATSIASAAPPAPVPFLWTGCYIGGNIGGATGASHATTTPNPAGLPAFVLAQATFGYDLDNSGVTGGVQYGCLRQFGRLVVGLDSDFNFSGLNNNLFASHPTQPNVGAYTESLSQNLNWFSTTRARAGYAWDRWLLFASGGLASGHLQASYLLTPSGPALNYIGSDSWTQYGWTIGAGAEYAVSDNWFVRGEYMYIDLGRHTFTSPGVGAVGGNPTFWSAEIDSRFHVARIALSYRFTTASNLLEWANRGFR